MSKRRPSILTALKQRVPAQSRILVAVSGGRDSMVLLHAFIKVRRLLGLHLEVCHVNHHLRESSTSDAEFVQEWCRGQHLECHVVALEARPHGENVEAWARSKRYAAFRQVMAARSLDVLCTAHTANDVAETLLIRLLANKELTSIEEYDPRRQCIRPLIDTTRDQINDYVGQWGVPFVEDPTNEDVSYVRNRIRHEVIPLLAERFDPSITWILADRARSLAIDSDALASLAASRAHSIGCLRLADRKWFLGAQDALMAAHPAVQWRIIQALFTPYFGHTIGEAKARAILEIMLEGGGVVQMGNGETIRVEDSALQIIPTILNP